MQSLSQKMTRVSWFFFHLTTYLGIYFVFRPTLIELGWLFLADTCALMAIIRVERPVITSLHPAGRYLYPTLDQKYLRDLPPEKRTQFFLDACDFPRWFANYCLFSSIVKAIPAFFVTLVIWHYPGSAWIQFFKSLAIFCAIHACFWGVTFIESHRFLSQTLTDSKLEGDWGSVFRGLRALRYSKEALNFQLAENLCMLSNFVGILLLQWLIITTGTDRGRTPFQVAMDACMVAVAGLTLVGRLLYLHRSFFYEGLENLFKGIESWDIARTHAPVPIHTAAALLRCEVAFNLLEARLQSYQKELKTWVLFQAEQSRFRALGEISALVAHDLTSPLQVLQYCVTELEQEVGTIKNQKILQHLSTNVHRAQQLVNSLRSSIRDKSSGPMDCGLLETWKETIRILETQFYQQAYHLIRFEFDPSLSQFRLQLTQPDLMHILNNLLSNSVKNLLNHRVAQPKIEIRLESKPKAGWIEIVIADNGTGLPIEKFEEQTAFASVNQEGQPTHRGLGLRLTRRLIEAYGGNMALQTRSIGTHLCLQLPIQEKRISREPLPFNISDELGPLSNGMDSLPAPF